MELYIWQHSGIVLAMNDCLATLAMASISMASISITSLLNIAMKHHYNDTWLIGTNVTNVIMLATVHS